MFESAMVFFPFYQHYTQMFQILYTQTHPDIVSYPFSLQA